MKKFLSLWFSATAILFFIFFLTGFLAYLISEFGIMVFFIVAPIVIGFCIALTLKSD